MGEIFGKELSVKWIWSDNQNEISNGEKCSKKDHGANTVNNFVFACHLIFSGRK